MRDGLAREREARLRHYSSIASSIDQCRVEYELVEERIREKERELIQLAAYFETRKQEDQQLVPLPLLSSTISERGAWAWRVSS